MKVLIDECVVQDFRHLVTGHDVYTVGYMGFAGLKNGALLAAAAANGFEVLVTTDRGMQHQQNPATIPIAVVILLAPTNDISDLKPLVPGLLTVLAGLPPRQVT